MRTQSTDQSPVPGEAGQVLRIARAALADRLVAAWLHGSAAGGGLRRDSDVDVLVVVERPVTEAIRSRLVSELMRVSGRPGSGARPLEVIICHRTDLETLSCPARYEFMYGEWLREDCEAGHIPGPGADPEVTLLLAQARHEAVVLAGPAPAELLPVIPGRDVRQAIRDLVLTLPHAGSGDERNILLMLARMWWTLETGEFASKDVAAAWAGGRLTSSSAALMELARRDYLGIEAVNWSPCRRETGRAIEELRARLAKMV